MLKQVTQFKAVIQNIESIFHFDSNCPIAIAKESLLECLKWIGQVEDAAKQQAAIEEEQKKNAESAQQESENSQEESKPTEPEGQVENGE